MHPLIHIMTAITLSMIIKFTLYLIMEHVPSRPSLLRIYWIDQYRDWALVTRCLLNKGLSTYDESCYYIGIKDNRLLFGMHSSAYVLLYIITVFASKIVTHIWTMLLTLFIVEILAQYASYLNLWFKIDVLTVNLFVWQLFNLLFSWIRRKLLSPIVIIEQGSFCLMAALLAWVLHYVVLRYIALKLIIVTLWFFAIVDIYNCLHYHGRCHHPSTTNSTFGSTHMSLPCIYYAKPGGEYQRNCGVGFLDILFYDIFLLLAVSQSLSVPIKVCVTFGSIVSVQVGYFLTSLLHGLLKLHIVPGIPLPFIIISIYLFFLDIIMGNSYECIEL